MAKVERMQCDHCGEVFEYVLRIYGVGADAGVTLTSASGKGSDGLPLDGDLEPGDICLGCFGTKLGLVVTLGGPPAPPCGVCGVPALFALQSKGKDLGYVCAKDECGRALPRQLIDFGGVPAPLMAAYLLLKGGGAGDTRPVAVGAPVVEAPKKEVPAVLKCGACGEDARYWLRGPYSELLAYACEGDGCQERLRLKDHRATYVPLKPGEAPLLKIAGIPSPQVQAPGIAPMCTACGVPAAFQLQMRDGGHLAYVCTGASCQTRFRDTYPENLFPFKPLSVDPPVKAPAAGPKRVPTPTCSACGEPAHYWLRDRHGGLLAYACGTPACQTRLAANWKKDLQAEYVPLLIGDLLLAPTPADGGPKGTPKCSACGDLAGASLQDRHGGVLGYTCGRGGCRTELHDKILEATRIVPITPPVSTVPPQGGPLCTTCRGPTPATHKVQTQDGTQVGHACDKCYREGRGRGHGRYALHYEPLAQDPGASLLSKLQGPLPGDSPEVAEVVSKLELQTDGALSVTSSDPTPVTTPTTCTVCKDRAAFLLQARDGRTFAYACTKLECQKRLRQMYRTTELSKFVLVPGYPQCRSCKAPAVFQVTSMLSGADRGYSCEGCSSGGHSRDIDEKFTRLDVASQAPQCTTCKAPAVYRVTSTTGEVQGLACTGCSTGATRYGNVDTLYTPLKGVPTAHASVTVRSAHGAQCAACNTPAVFALLSRKGEGIAYVCANTECKSQVSKKDPLGMYALLTDPRP